MACQRGCDDQSICRIGMKAGEPHSLDSNLAVDRKLDHPLFQMFPPPPTALVWNFR